MSTKPHNIFISWSGSRSKHVASALRQWLPDVIQSARPWMSDSDIDKGSRGIEAISKALETIEVGISCLTPENLNAPWLLFEAGALSKRIGDKSRLCTYLLSGLKNSDVPQPLGMFQHTSAEKAETRKMLDSINQAINPNDPVNLDRIFDKMWPDLDEAIKKLPISLVPEPAPRDQGEMIAEILDIVRDLQPIRQYSAGVNFLPNQFVVGTPVGFNRLETLANLNRVIVGQQPEKFRCSHCGTYSGFFTVDEGLKCVACGSLNTVASPIFGTPPVDSEPM